MGSKTSCNTTINKDLLIEEKALNIKLSPLFESALSSAVRDAKQKKWFADNESAIATHNEKIQDCGTFSEFKLAVKF